MSETVNSSILKIVKNFKASGKIERTLFTPMKRSMSTNSESSFDETTPVKKFKRESNLDLSYVGSPREMRRLRADLVEARNTILNLESRITQVHSVRKEMELMFDEETQQLKKQQEYDRKTIEDLENQLQEIRKREMSLKGQLAEVNNKCNVIKIHSDTTVAELEKSLSEIKEETRYNEHMENSEINKLKRELTQLKDVLQAAEDDSEAQKKLASEFEKRLIDQTQLQKDFDIMEQALQKAKLHIKELEYAKDNFLEYQDQAKTQAHKLTNYIEMEKEVEKLKEENVRLKDEVRNKLVLEEEVHDLRSRLVKFKLQEKKLHELEAQQVQIDMYLNEWRAVARGICETSDADSTLPYKLRSEVEKLQQQEIYLISCKVELESQLKTAIHEAKVAKAELEKIQKFVNMLKTTGDQKQSLIHRMQKKLLLVSRERDSYRLQLDSYEKDLTMNATTMSGTMGGQVQSQKDRIDRLEKINEGYRELIAKLENDLEIAQPGAYTDSPSYKSQQLTKLEEEINQLKLENNRLRERKDELEIQMESYLIGHDTLAGGKALTWTNNPLAECLAQRDNLVERLEQEVERLKRKVKSLEEGVDTSKLGDLSICPQEVLSLKEQIKSYESQMEKLKDRFKTSMQEFRNVIYILFGYRVDRTSSSVYKLRNVYAENEDDILHFQTNKEGDLNLLENKYSSTLEDMVNLHLRHQKSFPVFLSALTIDLFNNKTKTFSV